MEPIGVVVVCLGQNSEHQASTKIGATTDMSLFSELLLPNHCRFLTKASQTLPLERQVPLEAWDERPHLLYTPLSVLLLASESHPVPPGSASINSSWICSSYYGQDNGITI